MTWDEAELRAALRDGEGETLSPARIVALGEARRQRRHDRLRTAAVAVVVTGLLGGGVGALSQLHGGSESAGGNSANGRKALSQYGADRAAGGVAGSATGGTAAHGAAPKPLAPETGAAAVCPPHPAAVRWPADKATNTTAPLVTGKLTSITLCGYRGKPLGTQTLRGVSTLRGARAQKLADSLNASPSGVRAISCPPPTHSSSVVLYPVSGTTRETTVLLATTCGIDATDGKAERLIWNPPADLRSALEALTK